MNADHFRTLFAYNYWARDRVLAVMIDMPEPHFARSNGFTYGSIRGILTHCLDAEISWGCRLQGEPDPAVLGEGEVASPNALAQRWYEEEAKLASYLKSLTDLDLERDLVYRVRDGSERRLPLWVSLTHVVNHSTQHRSEAAEALTMVGRSPGDLDFGLYVREQGALGAR